MFRREEKRREEKRRGSFKRLIAFYMSIILLISVIPHDRILADTSMNGFSYNEDEYNVKWYANHIKQNGKKEKMEFAVKTKKGTKGKSLGTCTLKVGIARKKGTNHYVLMYRVAMTPSQKKVKLYGCIPNHGYGMSEYLKISTDLPSLGEYQPSNQPKSDTIDVGVGVTSGKELGINASYSVDIDELEITSKSDTSENRYCTVYDYKPHIPNIFASNKYFRNESIQLGTAEFTTDEKKFKLKIAVEARFGAAANKKRSPGCVLVGYTKKKSKTFTIDCKIPK